MGNQIEQGYNFCNRIGKVVVAFVTKEVLHQEKPKTIHEKFNTEIQYS